MNEIIKYKRGAFLSAKNKLSAKEITAALQDVSKNNDGFLEPKNVVNAARDKKSPLHNIFEWDNSVAGEKYRTIQASMLICSITIQEVESEPPRRYFSSIKPMGEGKSAYLPTSVALGNTFFRNQLLQKAIDDLDAAKKKYGNIAELEGVFKIYDKVKVKALKKENKAEKIMTVRATKRK